MAFSVFMDVGPGLHESNYVKSCKVFDWGDELLPEIIMAYGWCPGVFKNEHRRKENFLYADWFVLDFDDPEPTLADITKRFCDVEHVIGLTRNHNKEKRSKSGVVSPACNRFRLVIKAEERCESIANYEYTTRKLMNHFGSDPNAAEASRFYHPCSEIVSNTIGQCDMANQEILIAPKIIYRPPTRPVGGVFYVDLRLEKLEAGFRPERGDRNDYLYKTSNDLARQGADFDYIYSRLKPFFPSEDDFPESGIISTIRSSVRKFASCAPT